MAEAYLNVKQYFDTLPSRWRQDAARGVNAVFQFELSGEGGGAYNVTVNDNVMTVAEGVHAAPSVTLMMTANDYISLSNGRLNGQLAFMTGKMKVAGNMALAMKMQAMFPPAKAK
jgi:putative sterol carrier protein